MTAEEALRLLESDPEWVAARQREDREQARKLAEWQAAETPLVKELRAAGFEVDSAWDLVNTSTPYPEALPILLEHVGRQYPDRVREGIARALAVRDARFGWDRLRQLYEQEPPGTDAKHGLAVALAGAADEGLVDEVFVLAGDARHGESRGLLLGALERSRDPRVPDMLEQLGEDPELAIEVGEIFKRRERRRRDRERRRRRKG